MRVLITGGSGVLGSAIYNEFTKFDEFTVRGLSHSSKAQNLVPVDLLDPDATKRVVEDFSPDWVIHCAAERRPDVAEKDPAGAQKLNAEVPRTLAKLSVEHDFVLIYISTGESHETDYVFDGTSPPYEVDAKPHPLQFYGKTKLEGELAIRSVEGAGQRVVLRVPVLYGPVKKNSDTAINVLLDIVQDQSKSYKMDHYAIRYPTNTLDIANFLRHLAQEKGKDALPPIIHYTANEKFTKYEICLVLAGLLGVDHGHIKPDAEEPKPEAAVSRPRDCKLSTKVIEETLGMEVNARPFKEHWAGVLKR